MVPCASHLQVPEHPLHSQISSEQFEGSQEWPDRLQETGTEELASEASFSGWGQMPRAGWAQVC